MRPFWHASAIAVLWVGAFALGAGGIQLGIDAIDDGSAIKAVGSIALLGLAVLAFYTMYRLVGAYRRQHTDDQLPDELTAAPLTFRPNRRKWALFFVVFLVFIPGGVLWIRDGDVFTGVLALVWGSLGTVISAIVPRTSYLRISREGMTVRTLWRTDRYAWYDIHNFRAKDATGADDMIQRQIYFDLTAGGHGLLPDDYGLNPQQLALELNRYSERYGWSRTATSPPP